MEALGIHSVLRILLGNHSVLRISLGPGGGGHLVIREVYTRTVQVYRETYHGVEPSPSPDKHAVSAPLADNNGVVVEKTWTEYGDWQKYGAEAGPTG